MPGMRTQWFAATGRADRPLHVDRQRGAQRRRFGSAVSRGALVQHAKRLGTRCLEEPAEVVLGHLVVDFHGHHDMPGFGGCSWGAARARGGVPLLHALALRVPRRGSRQRLVGAGGDAIAMDAARQQLVDDRPGGELVDESGNDKERHGLYSVFGRVIHATPWRESNPLTSRSHFVASELALFVVICMIGPREPTVKPHRLLAMSLFACIAPFASMAGGQIAAGASSASAPQELPVEGRMPALDGATSWI